MPTIRDIEEAVRQLPPEALAEFRQWFAEFDAAAWDRQLEADARGRRLDGIAAAADAGGAFDFLNDPREDLYTEADGEPV